MDATSLRRLLGAVGLAGLFAFATVETSCATTDSSGAAGDTDAGGDAVPGCGSANTPCCEPNGSCEPGLFCNETMCRPQKTTDIGHPCKVDSDCQSGLCGYVQFPSSAPGDDGGTNEFPEGGGPPSTSVCTTGCTSDSQCTPGWQCTELSVGQGTCTCTAILELCNGKDDNCNGIIDDEPWADQDCSNNSGVPEVCKAATCGCVDTCQGTCVDLANDPTNCGTCGTNCDPNLQICQKGTCACGNAAGTVKVCGGQCVDTASDAKNCGACGTACTFTCASGACGPTTITSSSSISGKVFTLDATTVYWLDESTTPAVLDSCPITGCTKPKQLTTTTATFPSALVLANGTLYWNDSFANVIFSCPTSGCKTATTVFTDAASGDSMQGFTADATDVYYVEQDSSANTRVFKCAAAGCTAGTNLIGGTGTTAVTSALVLDGKNLVWFDGTELVLCGTAGCAAPEKIPTPKNVLFLNDLAAGGGTIVLTDGTSVYTVPEDPKGKVTTLVTTTGFSATPSGVATDGTNAYWSINATPTGTIEKCPVAGCPGGPDAGGPTTALAEDLDAPTYVQLGPSAIAWLQGSTTTKIDVFSK